MTFHTEVGVEGANGLDNVAGDGFAVVGLVGPALKGLQMLLEGRFEVMGTGGSIEGRVFSSREVVVGESQIVVGGVAIKSEQGILGLLGELLDGGEGVGIGGDCQC